MATIHRFTRRTPPKSRIANLFWLRPEREQHERIRALAKSRMSAETIATLTKKSLDEVRNIIEGRV